MKYRVVDNEIKLVEYYPNYQTTLKWYQDKDLCKQVDNRDEVYDLPLLFNKVISIFLISLLILVK